MIRKRIHGRVCLVMALAALAVPAIAGDRTTLTEDQQVAKLESLLEAQHARLASLQDRVVSSRSQNQDAARVEMMKQQIREVLSEQEFRESLMPSVMQAGYDKGFYIKSSDDRFKLKINGYMQFRWTHYGVSSSNRYLAPRLQRDDRTGFDLQRLRMIFSGHAWTPDLTYLLQLRGDAPGRYNINVRDAFVNYKFIDAFQVRAGIFKIAATQARLPSGRHLQFVSRPMVEAVFGLNRGLGVRLWGQCAEKRIEWFFDVTNQWVSPNDRTITNDPAERDNNPAIAFRTVWHAMGDKPGKDLKFESDLAYHETPALDFSFHYAFNDDQGDSRGIRIPYPIVRRPRGVGGFGLTGSNGLQINQFGFATAFKCHGFSARGEYILRIVDPRRAGRRPFAPWWLLTRQGDTTVQHGAYVQMGYFLPIPGYEHKIEAVVRAGGVSTLANGRDGSWEYAAGVNYFMEGDNAKVQVDVTKIEESPTSDNPISLANVNDSPLIFRVQLQFAF